MGTNKEIFGTGTDLPTLGAGLGSHVRRDFDCCKCFHNLLKSLKLYKHRAHPCRNVATLPSSEVVQEYFGVFGRFLKENLKIEGGRNSPTD